MYKKPQGSAVVGLGHPTYSLPSGFGRRDRRSDSGVTTRVNPGTVVGPNSYRDPYNAFGNSDVIPGRNNGNNDGYTQEYTPTTSIGDPYVWVTVGGGHRSAGYDMDASNPNGVDIDAGSRRAAAGSTPADGSYLLMDKDKSYVKNPYSIDELDNGARAPGYGRVGGHYEHPNDPGPDDLPNVLGINGWHGGATGVGIVNRRSGRGGRDGQPVVFQYSQGGMNFRRGADAGGGSPREGGTGGISMKAMPIDMGDPAPTFMVRRRG